MKRLYKMFIVTALFLLKMACLSAQIALTTDVPRVVESDETFRLVFSVNAQPSSFSPPAINGFDVLAGPTSSTMSSTQIINGRRTESFTVSYTYVLQARSVGKFTIPAATVVVDGNNISSQPVAIEVVKGSERTQERSEQATSISNEDIFLRVSVSKNRVVKGEHLIATIKLYTRVPISGFEDVRFPTFNGFWSQEIETPQSIEFVRESVDGKIYNSALLRRYMLMPQQSGTLNIETAEMICQVQIRSSATRSSRSIFDDFFDSYQTVRKRVTAPVVRINVDPLPGGAPESFYGGVGDFSMDTRLSRDSLNANEALSLIVTISGTGNLNLIEAPKTEFPASFEVYDVKITDNTSRGARGASGSKQFEYPLIPRAPGEYTIPAVNFTYFDIATKKYVTHTSGNLTVKVGRDTGSSQFASNVTAGPNRQVVRSIADDIRFIKTGSPHLKRGDLFFAGSLLYYLILVLIVVVTFILERLLSKHVERNRDIAGIKNRRANKVAKARLKSAQTLLKQSLYTGFYEELYRALLGYTSDKLNLSLADLSREKIKMRLIDKKVKTEQIDDLIYLLDQCEYARYSPDPGGAEMEKNYERAIRLISDMEV